MKKNLTIALLAAALALASLVPTASAEPPPGSEGTPISHLIDCSDSFWQIACATLPKPDGTFHICQPWEHRYGDYIPIYNHETNTWDRIHCDAFYSTIVVYR